MVASGLIDREDLDGSEVIPRSPFHELRESLRIAHPEVMSTPQSKERDQKSGDFYVWVERHRVCGWFSDSQSETTAGAAQVFRDAGRIFSCLSVLAEMANRGMMRA
jgi:hypothetical protein